MKPNSQAELLLNRSQTVERNRKNTEIHNAGSSIMSKSLKRGKEAGMLNKGQVSFANINAHGRGSILKNHGTGQS